MASKERWNFTAAFYSILHHNRYRMAKYECTCPRVLARRPSPQLREHAGGQGGRWKDLLGGGVHAACTESTISQSLSSISARACFANPELVPYRVLALAQLMKWEIPI